MYGCPGCGAELKYDIKTGKLRCSRCGNKYDAQAIKKDKDADSSLYEINEYVCPSCGGRIYTADNTIAGFCSYCGAFCNFTAENGNNRCAEINSPF